MANYRKVLYTLFIFSILLSNTSVAQTLTALGDYNISPTAYVTGISRIGALDIHKPSGKVVFIYQEADGPGLTTKDIYCVIFNSDMQVLVNAFRVNTTTTNDQTHATIKVNQEDNSFAVVWGSKQSGTDYDVYVKKFDFNGNALVGETLVNNAHSSNQYTPHAAFDYSRNEIVIGYRDEGNQDGGGAGSMGAFVRRFNYSSLTPINNQFKINQVIASNQVINAMAISPLTNQLIVLFQSNHVPGTVNDLYKTVLNYNTATNLYDTPVETRVNNYTPTETNAGFIVVNETTGDYVISWNSWQQDGSGSGCYSKIYNSTHAIVKDEFQVSNITADNQIYPKPVWDESVNQIIYFYYHTSGSVGSVMKYRIYDGLTTPGQYTAVGNEANAVGGLNTANYYSSMHLPVIYNPNLHIVYTSFDVYNNFTAASTVRARKFSFEHTAFNNESLCGLTDEDRNWVQVTTFDENGLITGETRSYSDKLGRETQTQTRNIVENKIITQATIYDAVGRAVITTLPAPITETCFLFNNNFIKTAGGQDYDYNYFDESITIANSPGEVNNPLPVANSALGTVGWYYSNFNNLLGQEYVPTTGYPYSRITHNDAIGGGVQRTSKPGEALRMGQNHEVSSISLPILWELNHYLALRKHFVPGVAGETIPSDFSFKGTKTIVNDENGIETVSFKNKDGQLLATAMSGYIDYVNGLTQNKYSNFSNSVRHTIESNRRYSHIVGAGNVEIYVNGDFSNPFYVGPMSLMPQGQDVFAVGTDILFHSVSPFSVGFSDINYGMVYYSSIAWNDGIFVKDYLDIHMPGGNEATINIIGSFQIYNLKNGLAVAYTSGNLPQGFYRIKNTNPASEVKVKYTMNYYDFTYYYYDDAGRMLAMVSPKGVNLASTTLPAFVSKNEYNTLGWTLSTINPDEGKSEYVCRRDGRVKFSRNAQQVLEHKFSYTNYDKIGRPVEVGEYNRNAIGGDSLLSFQNTKDIYNAVAVSNISIATILESVDGIDDEKSTTVSYTKYDVTDVGFGYVIPDYSQRFVNTKVSKTYNKAIGSDAAFISGSWYSYNEMGLLEWMVQDIKGLGVKAIDYEYDLNGNTKKVIYQKNTSAERFDHINTYDVMERLKKVETRLSGGALKEQAEYFYYLHGPLKRKEIGGNLQGIDYTYTIDGNLKAINHPYLDGNDPGGDSYTNGFRKDVFGMMLEYYTNDYVRGTKFQSTANLTGGQFNGNILSITWNTQPTSTTTVPVQYKYGYDKKYQLLNATWGQHSISTNQFISDPYNKYYLLMDYDKNGNIINNYRGDETGSTATSFWNLYMYAANTNKLTSTASYVTNQANRTFSYNSLGQLKGATSTVAGEISSKYMDYDVYGKVTAVYANSAKTQPRVKFLYDEKGQRLRKTTFSTSSWTAEKHTWYVRDASGNVLSIYETDLTITTPITSQIELPIYGADRIGMVNKHDIPATYNYELKDHLGNVRATIREYNNALNVLSWADYYPFGSIMPGRNAGSSPAYRNGYQGEFAEKDAETGWDNFDLRMYDANLGRWFAPDPYGQYHSPYMAMGNNPVNQLDPDGGYSWFGALWRSGFKFRSLENAGVEAGGWGFWTDPISIDVPSGASSAITGMGISTLQTFDPVVASTAQTFRGANVFSFMGRSTMAMYGTKALVKKAPEMILRLNGFQLSGGEYGTVNVPGFGGIVNNTIKLSNTKAALKEVHKIMGGSLPKGVPGKFGSPQRGTSTKGYRLDPAHSGRPPGHQESVPHINYWDYTNGKRGKGGISGAIPLIKP